MPRKKISNPVTLFYPNLLSVNQLLHDVVKDHKHIKVKERDYFLFFHILANPYINYAKPADTYIQVHSEIVQDVFGRDYGTIIAALALHEYILVNHYASEALGICKSYAIHPRLMDTTQPIKTVTLNYDTVLHNKMNRIGAMNFSKSGGEAGFGEGRDHVLATMSQMMLVPDADALAYVKAMYEKEGNPNTPETFFHYFNYNPVKGGGVDAFGNRVHSWITNLPKVLRRCLRFKSAPTIPTVESDIVNSQPFFLSVINAQLIERFVPQCKEAVALYAKYEGTEDYQRFCEIAANGTFYEEFIRLYAVMFGTSYGASGDEARTITKELAYGVFFSDYTQKVQGLDQPSRSNYSQLKKNFFKVFQAAFPNVYELFTELKALDWSFAVNRRGEHKPYANNCYLAQRVESGIMYDCLIPDLLAYDVTDVVTVHDCIIVKETDKATAIAVMNETFTQLGIKPKIK